MLFVWLFKIDFAIGSYNDSNVTSGMRANCEVFVELNGPLAFLNGIKFFVSKNGVVLSPGLNGVIEPKYFKRVIDKDNKILFSQQYEKAIYPFIYESKFAKLQVIDIATNQIETEVIDEDNELRLLNTFSSLYINKSLKRAYNTIFTIDKKNQSIIEKKIRYYKEKLNHIGLYSEFIVLEKEQSITTK